MRRRFGLASRESQLLLIELEKRREDLIWNCSHPAWTKPQRVDIINMKCKGLYEMTEKAKKSIATKLKNDGEFSWKGFVDVKLSDTDKANYAAWDIEESDVWDGIATYCEAGIKIALSHNKQNASFNCAGTGQPASGNNSGYCVVAHAKDPYNAARVWLYKVSVMLPDQWNEYDSGDQDAFG